MRGAQFRRPCGGAFRGNAVNLRARMPELEQPGVHPGTGDCSTRSSGRSRYLLSARAGNSRLVSYTMWPCRKVRKRAYRQFCMAVGVTDSRDEDAQIVLVPCASTWPGTPWEGSCGRGPHVACNRPGRAFCDQVAADHCKANGLRIGYDSLNSAFPEAEIVTAGVSRKAEKRYSS